MTISLVVDRSPFIKTYTGVRKFVTLCSRKQHYLSTKAESQEGPRSSISEKVKIIAVKKKHTQNKRSEKEKRERQVGQSM